MSLISILKVSIFCIVFAVLLVLSESSHRHRGHNDDRTHRSGLSPARRFPADFMFGVATAAYQAEGAWNEDGKTDTIWDHMLHENPCFASDCSNGDIADDSYHQYKRDVQMLRELGVDHYRFSIAWPRILPSSFPHIINEAGVRHYNNLIDELLKYGITPMVTLYHWELPQRLQDMGGWTNPYIINWFGDYARVIFKLFGDRVKHWMTVNEPYQICPRGYGDVAKAPVTNMSGIADYMCTKNLLMAHARAYRIYDEEFRANQGGLVFIAFSGQWYEPESEDQAQAAEDCRQFQFDQFMHPIFSKAGDFPPEMKKRVAAKSAAQGFPRSRLPELTPKEIAYIRGTADLFGLNHYSTFYVYRNESIIGSFPSPSLADDQEVGIYALAEWQLGESSFVNSVPWGFTNLLKYIREKYNNPPIVITENGFASSTGLKDDDRVEYMRRYLGAMLDAIDEGSNVLGFTVWSLMDVFEWKHGYNERFGLYEVDYSSRNRTRTPRKSAFVYKQILRSRTLDFTYEPEDISAEAMTIDPGH